MRARWSLLGWLLLALLAAGLFVLLPQGLPSVRWLLMAPFRKLPLNSPRELFDNRKLIEQLLPSYQAHAQQHPDDFEIQLSYALIQQWLSGGSGANPALYDLLLRFPERPELYATILRLEFQQFVLHRQEGERLFGGNPGHKPAQTRMAQQVLQLAREGEQVDPQNGFFPMVQAVALFELRRDAEALRALQRAARLPRWNDHATIEAIALRKAGRQILEYSGADMDYAWSAQILLPHYSSLRAMGRLNVALAVQRERQGDLKGGLAIRQQIIESSLRMGEECPLAIGVLVARVMYLNALRFPSGVRDTPVRDTPEQQWEIYHQRFTNYLLRSGFQREAQAFRAYEARARAVFPPPARIGALSEQFLKRTFTPLYRLRAAIAIAFCMLWTLLAMGVALIIARRVRPDEFWLFGAALLTGWLAAFLFSFTSLSAIGAASLAEIRTGFFGDPYIGIGQTEQERFQGALFRARADIASIGFWSGLGLLLLMLGITYVRARSRKPLLGYERFLKALPWVLSLIILVLIYLFALYASAEHEASQRVEQLLRNERLLTGGV